MFQTWAKGSDTSLLPESPTTAFGQIHASTVPHNGTNTSSQNIAEPGRADSLPNVPARRSKTKEEREAAKGDKAGNPGRFHGEAFLYLSRYVTEYNAIDKTSKGKNTRLGKFWHKIKAGFWEVATVDEARKGLDGSAVMSDDEVVNVTNEVSRSSTASDSLLTCLL